MTKTAKSDFDPVDFTKKSDQHDQDISTIKERLDALEDRFGTNEKIAETLCDTASKATRMQDMLSETFVKLLTKDEKVKEALGKFIDNSDRGYLFAFVKRIGFLAWSAIIFLLGLVANGFIQSFFKK